MKKLVLIMLLAFSTVIANAFTSRVVQQTQQADGKQLDGGYIEMDGKRVAAVRRMTSQGNLDNTFGVNGVALLYIPYGEDVEVRRITAQPQGKILVEGDVYLAGASESENANARERFAAQLNSDGTLDTNYGEHGIQISNGKSKVL